MVVIYMLLGVLVIMSVYRTCGVKKTDTKSLLQSDYKEFLRITRRVDNEESWRIFIDLINRG